MFEKMNDSAEDDVLNQIIQLAESHMVMKQPEPEVEELAPSEEEGLPTSSAPEGDDVDIEELMRQYSQMKG